MNKINWKDINLSKKELNIIFLLFVRSKPYLGFWSGQDWICLHTNQLLEPEKFAHIYSPQGDIIIV